MLLAHINIPRLDFITRRHRRRRSIDFFVASQQHTLEKIFMRLRFIEEIIQPTRFVYCFFKFIFLPLHTWIVSHSLDVCKFLVIIQLGEEWSLLLSDN